MRRKSRRRRTPNRTSGRSAVSSKGRSETGLAANQDAAQPETASQPPGAAPAAAATPDSRKPISCRTKHPETIKAAPSPTGQDRTGPAVSRPGAQPTGDTGDQETARNGSGHPRLPKSKAYPASRNNKSANETPLEESGRTFPIEEYANGAGLVWPAAFGIPRDVASIKKANYADMDETLKMATMPEKISPSTLLRTTMC